MAFTLRFSARLLSVAILRGYATKANSMKEATKKAAEKKPAATRQKVTMATACTPTVKSPKRSPQAKPVAAAAVAKVKKTKAASKPAEKRISAYTLFMKEKYPMMTGATMPEKVKELGTLWKTLPEVEKAKYIARSQGPEGIKKKLLSGMTVYIKENFARAKDVVALVKEWKELPAPQKQVYNDRASHGEGAKVVKNRKTVRKASGYSMYVKENYAKFQGTLVERMKLLVENWKKMSTKEKAKYHSQEAAAPAKRTLSGYVLFLKEKMNGVKGNVTDHVKQAAVEWKAMTAEKQNEYKLKAKAL